MKNAARFAPYIATNAKILVGEKVGCYTFDPIGGVTNLAAVCMK